MNTTATALANTTLANTTDSILVYVVIVALFISLPWVIDIFMAYRSQNKTRKLLLDKVIDSASKGGLSLDELKELLKESNKAPGGMQGLSRASMALSVILILGIAVFQLLAKAAPTAGDSQIVGNILSMLGGLLAAITGFYFGGRSAEQGAEKAAEKKVETTGQPSNPSPSA